MGKRPSKLSAHYPAGFWVLAGADVLECLAYYLGRSLILLFVAKSIAEGGLGLSDSTGARMQSLLTALGYILPILGGIVIDHFLGARYTTPLGLLLAGVGYMVGSYAESASGMYVMIICVSLGLAMFKTVPILGRIITDKKQRDSAFTISYAITNFGSFIGPLLVGFMYNDWFAVDGVLGFRTCFKVGAVFMLAGAVFFTWGWRWLGDAGKKPFVKEKSADELEKEAREKAELKKRPLEKIEKTRIVAIILSTWIFVAVFWCFWYLVYLVVYYHWMDNMNWVVLGYEVPTTWFDAFNALFVVAAGPLFATLWSRLARRPQGDMSYIKKIGIGIGIMGLCFVCFAIFETASANSTLSCLWLLLFLVLMTVGELFFSPLGSSFISKYAPPRFYGLLMSCSFGIAIGASIYSFVYDYAFDSGKFSFNTACIGIAVICFVCFIALLVLDKPLKKLYEDPKQ